MTELNEQSMADMVEQITKLLDAVGERIMMQPTEMIIPIATIQQVADELGITVEEATEYIHTVYPMAWCSICGPGGCEHTQRMNKSLIESFMETKNAPPRKRKPRPDYPVWVCSPCGDKYGRRKCGIATWHEDDCGVCGQRGMVTEPRDFGHLKDGWEMEKRK